MSKGAGEEGDVAGVATTSEVDARTIAHLLLMAAVS